MTDNKNKRRGLLDTLLGKEKSDEVRESTQKAQALLDAAKIARKEGDPAEAAAEADAFTKAILGALTDSGIVDVILNADNSPVKTPEELAKLIGDAVAQAVAAEPAEAAPAEAMPAMAGKADEKPEASEEIEDMKSIVKSLSDYLTTSTDDNGLMAKAIVEIAGAIKDISAANGDLVARMSSIEKLVNGRPRQASKAVETETDNPELESKIKEGVEGEMTFLGVPVKAMPSAGSNGKGK